MTSTGKVSIYDSIGGAAAVAAAVDLFYERVLADPDLAGYFTGVDIAKLKSHQRSFIAAAIGGPEVFSGRSMKDAHAHLNVRPEHFDRVVDHLVATLTELSVPADVIGRIGATLAPLKADIAPTPLPAAGD
ncbi:MAG TPA: group 1 truncated hemoglobin [Pseudonocardia sp.]|jgi:hemoglobin|uniref:group I truncated hemoglobin n=1 Tax=Pseudonocardia sp. TaxID=60912 RepID=UPI002B4AD80C|nr:group 1 truncated hemoglobin [Pseudonocardia sp.]HLU56935.1 group 1 truncated hemoglobin [Pseudonocardia sp.]